MIDGRSRRPMKDWSRIIDARIVHGYNAASSLASRRPAPLCVQCHSQEIKNIPPMRMRLKDDGSIEWHCTRCGGTETIQVRLTAENIKKREAKVASDMELFIKYAPFYSDFKQMFSACLESSSKLREDLAREFDRQEIESHKLSFHTHYSFFIQHYDPGKKGKRRCSIPKNDIIKITVCDSTYRECIQLLADLPTELTPERVRIWNVCIGRLKKFRYPLEYAYDKVEYDMKVCLSNH